MRKILQTDTADDFVIGRRTNMSVRQFVERAFSYVNLDWREYVRFDESYVRPAEADELLANPSKAEVDLGWSHSVSTEELGRIMVDHDIKGLDGFAPDSPVGKVWEEATRA